MSFYLKRWQLFKTCYVSKKKQLITVVIKKKNNLDAQIMYSIWIYYYIAFYLYLGWLMA